MAGEDLYAALGVARDASDDDIKSAYRKLARKHHPDLNPGDSEAEERFKRISAAFDVLGDPKKRATYDEFGEEGLRSGFDPEQARAYRKWRDRAGAGGGRNANLEDLFGHAGFDLGDMFGDLGGAGGVAARRPQRGGDITASLRLSLRDAVLGTEREISLNRPSTCATCHGNGRIEPTPGGPCDVCNGSGRRSAAQGPIAFQVPCGACGGTGRQLGPSCSACSGSGFVERLAHLKVKIPVGIDDGQTIRLAGQGMPGTAGAPAGNLLIQVEVAPHPKLRRDGNDLELDLPVTVREAMFGAKVEVPTLQGSIKVTVPAGSQSGARLRIKGKGVPAAGKRAAGDLYLVLHVALPKTEADDEAARKAADELEQRYETNVRSELKL
jgi:molecular chaperone DnaJ